MQFICHTGHQKSWVVVHNQRGPRGKSHMSDGFMSFRFLTWNMRVMLSILPMSHKYKEFIHSFFSPHSEFGKNDKLQNAVLWE